jgi:hypothetical protein
MVNNKWVCVECDWHGVLDSEHTLIGCLNCNAVDTLRLACDVADCWCEVTCGTPTADGYLRTCGKHVPTPTWIT